MALSGEERAFCVLEFHASRSPTDVQRKFRTKYHKDPPSRKAIYAWYDRFVSTGCLCPKKRSGRPAVNEETVNRVRETFVRSPRKSIRRASQELTLPCTTVWRTLRKRLSMKPYKLQLVQQLKPNDKERRFEFCVNVQRWMEEDDDIVNRIIFSDEATFHTNGKVNRHNCRVWGTQNPLQFIEYERDSPKVNVFCAISSRKLYGPFFFTEKTVTGCTYLDMIEQWLFPQLQEDSNNFLFQQDGAPPHYHTDVRAFLNDKLPQRWLGRAGNDDNCYAHWPPRSPDLTPCDFFLWGYIKDNVYVPPLPQTLEELKHRIEEVAATVSADMLKRVWQEFDYRVDICRVTRGSHIESL